MIQAFIVFLIITLLVLYGYHTVSKFTMREYKLAFKIGAAATVSLLILFIISLL